MKFALSLFFSFLCFGPVLAQQPAADSSVPDKEAVTARFAAVNTIESRFTQQKFMALLEEPVTSEGVFYFEKPSRIRWQYTKPFQNGFLIIVLKVPTKFIMAIR